MEVASIYINRILLEVVKKKAHSLRLSIGSFPMLRIDGKLSQMDSEGIIDRKLITGIINILVSNDEWNEIEKKREAVLVRSFSGGLRFRINIYFQKDLPSISFFLITDRSKPIQDLGLPGAFINFSQLTSGLVVVAGSAFSGKSTTVASTLEYVNANAKRFILTLEDPIEKIFVNQKSIINQRQVGRDVATFESGLKYSLEEDVDIIYVNDPKGDLGKIMSLIFDLASGNSLVILEISASSVVSVLEKILSSTSSVLSATASQYYLSHILKGILVQKLLPKKGGGMVPAFELLVATSAIESLIREGNTMQIENVMESSGGDGMIIMDKSINTLKKQGLID